jgi:signal transduction histidine kinase
MGYSKHSDDHLQVAVRDCRRMAQNHRTRILDQVDLEDQVRADVGIKDDI